MTTQTQLARRQKTISRLGTYGIYSIDSKFWIHQESNLRVAVLSLGKVDKRGLVQISYRPDTDLETMAMQSKLQYHCWQNKIPFNHKTLLTDEQLEYIESAVTYLKDFLEEVK